MSNLPFERPLVETARRINAIRDTRVELAHNEPPAVDPWIRELHEAGYVRIVFTPAFQRRPDFWRLTDAGQEWLRRADLPQLPTATVRCPDCWAVPGDQHELSCSEVSPELAAAYIEAVHGAKES